MKREIKEKINKENDIWIGLVHVKSKDGAEKSNGFQGAFVLALGLATDKNDYMVKVKNRLEADRFDVEEITDIERFYSMKVGSTDDSPIYKMINSISKSNPVLIDRFHTYES